MLIVATMDHGVELELLITDIEQLNVPKNKIHVSLLEKINVTESTNTLRIAEKGIQYSFIDLSMSIGTVLAIIGAIYGYSLQWGPIIWGLIGFFTGVTISYIPYKMANSNLKSKEKQDKEPEVLLFIECENHLQKNIKELLMNYCASGMAIIKK
jgi:hypothetical protein